MSLGHSKFFLNVVLKDAAGNESKPSLELNYADWTAFAAAVVAGDIAQIITDLEAVTGATVASYSYGDKYIEDTDIYGAAGSEVENLASLSCLIDGEVDKFVTLRIPAPVDNMFLGTTGPNRNIVDTSFAALQTWLDHFSTSGEILVSDGESITDPSGSGAFKGKRIHRGSRKG